MAVKLSGNDDVSYTISAQDVSAAAINSAISGTRRLESGIDSLQARMKSQFANIQKHWLGMTAAAYAAVRAIQGAWDLMGKAADYNERINALDDLGRKYGMTGEQIAKSMKEASRGLLTMAESADMAASAINLSLNPRQMIEFTQVAESLTDVIGGTIPEAFDRMVIAAAAGRTQTLAQMGIIISLEDVYKKWARENDRTVKSLTEAEKQQIRLNAILSAAKEKIAAMGPPQDTFRDKMDRMTASIKDAQLWLGQMLMRAALMATGAFQWLASGATSVVSAFNSLHAAWIKMRLFTDRNLLTEEGKKQLQDSLVEIKATIAALDGSAVDLAGKAAENMSAAVASVEDLATAMSNAAAPPAATPMLLEAPDQDEIDKLVEKYQMEFRLALQNVTPMESMLLSGQAVDIGALEQAEEAAQAFSLARQEQSDFELFMIDHQQRLSDMERTRRETEMQYLVESTEFKKALMQDEHVMALANVNEYTGAVIDSEQRTHKYRVQAAQNAAGAIKNISESLLEFAGENNEAMFRVAQAAAIAEAIVNTYAGATKALKDYSYPYNIVAAAAVIAFGLLQVAKISSARVGMRSAGSSGGGAVGTYPASSTTGFPETSSPATEKKQGAVVNIHVYGNIVDQDKFAREMVPSITKALEDGAH